MHHISVSVAWGPCFRILQFCAEKHDAYLCQLRVMRIITEDHPLLRDHSGQAGLLQKRKNNVPFPAALSARTSCHGGKMTKMKQ